MIVLWIQEFRGSGIQENAGSSGVGLSQEYLGPVAPSGALPVVGQTVAATGSAETYGRTMPNSIEEDFFRKMCFSRLTLNA
jgi:hypothetical protein